MIRTTIAMAAAAMLVLAPATAMGKGKGGGPGGGQGVGNGGGQGGGPGNNNRSGFGNSDPAGVIPAVQQTLAALTATERTIITEYFQANYGNLPPGLANRQSLPPGLQRQLERNGTLPPGLTRTPLPAELRGRLPGREGLEILVIDNEVVLVAAATLVIVDVLFDVF